MQIFKFFQNKRAEISSAGIIAPIVKSSIDLYQTTIKLMRPIPAKSHYVFNLRDMGKLFQGLLLSGSDICNDPTAFTKLWIHEVMDN